MSAVPATGLNTGGWLFLVLAWGVIVGVTVYCFYRLFQTQDRPPGSCPRPRSPAPRGRSGALHSFPALRVPR